MWIKFCISSILYRPDSQKAHIIPDASMLRKLLRDRACRPVLRGILENLLQYLTQDLSDRTTRTQDGDELVFKTSFPRKRGCPEIDQRIRTLVKQPELNTSRMPVIYAPDKMSKRETSENRCKIPGKKWCVQPQERFESMSGGGERVEDPTPRRLTTFRLLQSKFIRSTPKPPLTNRREVGTLSFGGGTAGAPNHRQDGVRAMSKDRREHKRKRGGIVKDTVAKFAMTEQKEMGLERTSRLIGKGILLSSLMEKFDNMAIVSKGIKSKWPRERPPGIVSVKQRVACCEKGHSPAVDANDLKQSQGKKVTSKSLRTPLKANQRTAEGPQNPEEKLRLNLKGGRIPPHSDDNGFNLLHHIRSDAHCGSSGEIDCEGEETIWTTAKLNYARQELIQFRCVTQRCLPGPCRLVLHSDAPLKCHMTIVLPCSILWSTCGDCSPKQYFMRRKHEASASPDTKQIEKDTYFGRPSIGTDYSSMGKELMDDTNRHRHAASQRGLPHYAVPHICRFDAQQGDAQHSESLLAKMQTSPWNCSTNVIGAGLSTKGTLQESRPLDVKVQSVAAAEENKTERTFRQKRDQHEVKSGAITAEMRDTEVLPQSCQTSEPVVAMLASPAQSQLPMTSKTQRAKYTSINYGDPAVKQTYKPKVIRFTDTFTF